MPESPNDRVFSNSIRRLLDEGARRAPDRVRQLPGHAVRAAVIGVDKVLRATQVVHAGYGEVRRNGVTPTADRLRRDGLAALRTGVPARPAAHTPPPGERAPGQEPAAGESPAAATPSTGAPPSGAAGSADARSPAPPAGPSTEAPAAPTAEPAAESTPEPAAESTPEIAEPTVAPESTPGTISESAPAAPEAPPAHDELPVPNYDAASLGSLRARLRNLTISDLGTLLAYERAHQNRESVINMFENRILKLEREQGQ